MAGFGAVALKIVGHAAALALLCAMFLITLFLGLQVSTVAGNAGLVVTAAAAGAYIWFGFIRRRRAGKAPGGD